MFKHLLVTLDGSQRAESVIPHAIDIAKTMGDELTLLRVVDAANSDWSERGGYMLARHGIHPAWANEALDDPDRLVITPDPASKSGRAVRTIGWSYTANRIITVITLVDNGRLHGVNGWVANSNDQRLYREEDRYE